MIFHKFEVAIDALEIETDDMLTLWLCKDDAGNREQVEVRVLKDGTCEIFAHLDRVIVKDFKEWEPMK